MKDLSLSSDVGISALSVATAAELFSSTLSLIVDENTINNGNEETNVISRELNGANLSNKSICIDFFISHVNNKLSSKVKGVF